MAKDRDRPRSELRGETVAATDRLIAESPELASLAVRAITAAHSALRADPDCAAEIGKKRFPELEARLIAGLVRRDLPYYDATISPQTVGQMNRFARTMGILDSEVAYEDVVATSLQALWTPPVTR